MWSAFGCKSTISKSGSDQQIRPALPRSGGKPNAGSPGLTGVYPSQTHTLNTSVKNQRNSVRLGSKLPTTNQPIQLSINPDKLFHRVDTKSRLENITEVLPQTSG